ncbi:MAG: VOC family protein [Pseudaminobacter sp.]|nr:VOC family protein [Pseudaminobacter sp.]
MSNLGDMAALVPELLCSNAQASIDIYRRVFGFSILYARPEEGFAYLDMNGAQIMLEQLEDNSWLAAELSRPFGRGINIQIDVEDVGSIHDSCRKEGLTIFRPMEERWYRRADLMLGCRQFIVQDPDGYLLRFAQSIGTRPAGED